MWSHTDFTRKTTRRRMTHDIIKEQKILFIIWIIQMIVNIIFCAMDICKWNLRFKEES